MNVLCHTDVCSILLSSKCVFYNGDPLFNTGINTNENLESVLQKIDEKFTSLPSVDLDPLEERVEFLENLASQNTGSYFTGQAYAIWTGTGLVFDVIWPVYFLDGVQYPAGSDQVTLDPADGTNPRLDVIGVDALGAMFIAGIPSANPEKPTIDPITQLEITVVLVNAGATEPGNITDEIVYNENVEATVSSNNGTLDADDTTDPFAGVKHISIGSFNNTHYIDFTLSTPKQITDYSILRYYKKLLATFANNTYLRFSFYDGATLISNVVNVTNNTFNYKRTITAAYQIITIPFSAFTFTQSEFTKIRISFAGSNASGFRFDYFTLQSGVPTISPLQNNFRYFVDNAGNIAEATQPNDIFTFKGLLQTGAKEFTVDGGGHEILDQDGNPLVQEDQLQFVRLNVTADTGKTVVTRPADTFVGISPPSSPVEGDIWTDTNDTVWKTYVRYDGYWVERQPDAIETQRGVGGVGNKLYLFNAY